MSSIDTTITCPSLALKLLVGVARPHPNKLSAFLWSPLI